MRTSSINKVTVFKHCTVPGQLSCGPTGWATRRHGGCHEPAGGDSVQPLEGKGPNDGGTYIIGNIEIEKRDSVTGIGFSSRPGSTPVGEEEGETLMEW